jgi:nucleotide-binding universal stress UspA family protein
MYKKILVPLDGSSLAEKVLKHIKEIVTDCGMSEFVLLTVVEPFREQPFRKEDNWNVKIQKEAVRVAGNYLKVLQERLQMEGVKSEIAVIEGIAANEILDYAARNEIDLIMINSKGKTASIRTAFGGVADRIIRHSTIPVLVTQEHESLQAKV